MTTTGVSTNTILMLAAGQKEKKKIESAPTHLGGVWPTADADHYPHTAALFAQIAFVTVI